MVNNDSVPLPARYNELTSKEKYKTIKQYKVLQNGLCHFCKESLADEPAEFVLNTTIEYKNYPFGFFATKNHLYFNNNTGLTIGVVHARCNAYLWENR